MTDSGAVRQEKSEIGGITSTHDPYNSAASQNVVLINKGLTQFTFGLHCSSNPANCWET